MDFFAPSLFLRLVLAHWAEEGDEAKAAGGRAKEGRRLLVLPAWHPPFFSPILSRRRLIRSPSRPMNSKRKGRPFCRCFLSFFIAPLSPSFLDLHHIPGAPPEKGRLSDLKKMQQNTVISQKAKN